MGVARVPAVRLLFQDERPTPAALTFLPVPNRGNPLLGTGTENEDQEGDFVSAPEGG